MQIAVCTIKEQVFDQAFVAMEGKNNRFVLCKIGVERFIRKAALKKSGNDLEAGGERCRTLVRHASD